MLLRENLAKHACCDEWSISGLSAFDALGESLAEPACFDEWSVTGLSAFDVLKRI